MCHPPALVGYCGGARRCVGRRTTARSAPLQAIKPWLAAIACVRSWRGRGCHCCGPSSPGVQQLLACVLGEVADAALSDAILEVGIYATEGKLLASVVTCLFEGIIGESPIVTVVVLDSDTVFGSEGLEGAFGSGKDGGAAIALLGKFSLELRLEPWLG
jgi:hypothetical protein